MAGGKKITVAIVQEAWRLRKAGIFTMREIADKLGVNREALIERMEDDARGRLG